MKAQTEASNFEQLMKSVLSVSHDEIKKREKEWKDRRVRGKKGRPKTAPASRVATVKD